MKKLNIKGFAHLEAITLIVVIVLISLIGYKVLTASHADNVTAVASTKIKITLEAQVDSYSSVQLSWTPIKKVYGNKVTSYNVIRNGAQITSTNGSTSDYTDTGLKASTPYTYIIQGVKNSKITGQSTSISVTTTSGLVGCAVPYYDNQPQQFSGAVVVTEMQQNNNEGTIDVSVPVNIYSTSDNGGQYYSNIDLLNPNNAVVSTLNSQSPKEFTSVSTSRAGCSPYQDDNSPYAVVLGYGFSSSSVTTTGATYPWALANGILENSPMTFHYEAAGTPKGAVTGGQWITTYDSSGIYSYPAIGSNAVRGSDYIVLTYIEPASQ